jgi:hypothetical protein
MKRIKLKVLSIVFVSLLLVSCDRQEKVKEQKKPEPPKPAPVASMLTLVPDDTVFFVGGTEPFPLKERLQWTAEHFKFNKELLNPQALQKFSEEAKTDGQRMAVQLWSDYIATIVSQDTQLASWGFEEKPMLASYAIGLAPVLRISLNNVELFNKKIAELEGKAKVASKPEKAGTAVYRRYSLNEKKAETDSIVSLIIGVDGNNAVFMLDLGVDSEQTLAAGLGQSKPEKSLEQSGRLKALQDKYKLLPSQMGYIDHQQLITGITTKDGNRMAKMVQLLAPQFKENGQKNLAELQSEGCRNDLQAIGRNWPQTVGGYTAVDLKAKPSHMDSLVVVESNDQPLLDGLQSLRGFVPDYAGPAFASAISSFAVGLNVENVTPFLTKQWTEITQKQYNCGFLKDMQQSLKGGNPAMAGMVTGMAAGVRGIAFSLLSLKMDQAQGQKTPMPKELDALISLSAKDPAALVQTASALLPQLAEVKIPADGTPVKLPVPMPLPFAPMAAINGSHLTVYAGQQAEQLAKELGKATLESSQGFLAGSFDYGRYYGLMTDIMPAAVSKDDPKAAEAAALLEAMKNAKMRVQMKMDFTTRGIEVKTDILSAD